MWQRRAAQPFPVRPHVQRWSDPRPADRSSGLTPIKTVGASLLANREYQSTFTLTDTPLSRAGSLPQGFGVYRSTLCLAAYRHSISIASVAAASDVISALSRPRRHHVHAHRVDPRRPPRISSACRARRRTGVPGWGERWIKAVDVEGQVRVVADPRANCFDNRLAATAMPAARPALEALVIIVGVRKPICTERDGSTSLRPRARTWCRDRCACPLRPARCRCGRRSGSATTPRACGHGP